VGAKEFAGFPLPNSSFCHSFPTGSSGSDGCSYISIAESGKHFFASGYVSGSTFGEAYAGGAAHRGFVGKFSALNGTKLSWALLTGTADSNVVAVDYKLNYGVTVIWSTSDISVFGALLSLFWGGGNVVFGG